MSDYQDEVDYINKLFGFLTGTVPDGMCIKSNRVPNLTKDQADCVIWFLATSYKTVSDYVYPCDVCGEYYHSYNEGQTMDWGKGPTCFCGRCLDSDEYERKRRSKFNPDEEDCKDALEEFKRNKWLRPRRKTK